MSEVNLIGITQPNEEHTGCKTANELIAWAARVSNPSNQNNTATASKLVQYLIQNKPKAVLLADRYFDSQPWAAGLAPVANKLTASGIPTIVFGPIPTASFDPSVSWIRPDPKVGASPLDRKSSMYESMAEIQTQFTNPKILLYLKHK